MASAALSVYGLVHWWPVSGVVAVPATAGFYGLLVATAQEEPELAELPLPEP